MMIGFVPPEDVADELRRRVVERRCTMGEVVNKLLVAGIAAEKVAGAGVRLGDAPPKGPAAAPGRGSRSAQKGKKMRKAIIQARVGRRNSYLASQADSLQGKGHKVEAIYTALLDLNASCCYPPLPDAEVRIIAESYGGYATGEPGGTGQKICALRRKP